MAPERSDPASLWDARLADDELERWESGLSPHDRHSLTDLVNRVLDKGVVITGEITISVAGVELVYLGLNAVLTSITTARRVAGAPPEGRFREP